MTEQRVFVLFVGIIYCVCVYVCLCVLSQIYNFIWQGHYNVAIALSVWFCMDAVSVNFAEKLRLRFSCCENTNIVQMKRTTPPRTLNQIGYIISSVIIIFSLKTLPNVSWTHAVWALRQPRKVDSLLYCFLKLRKSRSLNFVHSSFPRV